MLNDPTRRRLMIALAAAGGSAALGGLLPGCDSKRSAPVAGGDNGQPRRGGRLRLGIIDGNQAGNLDVHKPLGMGSTIRGFALYSKLWEWSDDMFPQLALAEFAEPNADASTWTIRLLKGLEFHNGKTINADDVIFSIRRLTDPEFASPNGATVSLVDRDRIVKLDERTVRIPFKNGIGFLALPDTWVNFGGIVPPDYDPITNPVGAGPFKAKDFRPGQRSLFTRFENYFRSGAPYPDELEIIDFKDQDSRFQALLADQLDMAFAIAPEQAVLLRNEPRASLLTSKSNWWRGFALNATKPPFDDVRVRQAFRLLADRQELVQRVLYGHGQIGNDLYAPHDPTFDHSIPQRPHDPEQARRLLREAGVDKLSLELVTDGIGEGSSLVLAEQIKKFGIDVSVKRVDLATYNGPLKDGWQMTALGTLGQPFLAAAIGNDGPYSQANRSNFHDRRFDELVMEALRTPDINLRAPLVHEAQRIEYDRGGLLIWGFQDTLDGIAPKVGGIHAERSHFPTWRFDRLWLKS